MKRPHPFGRLPKAGQPHKPHRQQQRPPTPTAPTPPTPPQSATTLHPLTPQDLAQSAEALQACARSMAAAAEQWRATPGATLESILTYDLGTRLVTTGLALNDFGQRAAAHPFTRAHGGKAS